MWTLQSCGDQWLNECPLTVERLIGPTRSQRRIPDLHLEFGHLSRSRRFGTPKEALLVPSHEVDGCCFVEDPESRESLNGGA